MEIEISSLLIGSGFALFLVLLAWGNKIREPRQDIKDLENKFVDTFKLSKKKFKPLVKDAYQKLKISPMDGFLEQVTSMVDIMDKLKSPDDVDLIDKFKLLHNKRELLEKFYKSRYISSLTLTFILLVSGILSLFNGTLTVETPVFISSYNAMYLLSFVIILFIILILMAIIYHLEEKFIQLLDETDELIEVG